MQCQRDEGWWEYQVLSPSVSSSSPSSVPSSSLSSEGDNVGASCCVPGRRSSFSYLRLPEPLIRLTVLKLDGTSFDVRVARSGSVWLLKMAIEGLFSRPVEDGGIDVSWSHVWSHFCLCYEGQKLLDDRTHLRSLGIKDGDQLQFIRHMSINYSSSKRRPKNHEPVPEQQLQTISLEGVEDREMDENGDDEDESSIDTEDDCSLHSEENGDLTLHTRFRLAHIFRWWLSYSKLWSSKRELLQRTRSSILGGNY